MVLLVQWKKWISGHWTRRFGFRLLSWGRLSRGPLVFDCLTVLSLRVKWMTIGLQNGYRPRPLVKTLDLKSAYKQLALNDLEARKSVICLKCPDDGRVYGFVCKTLPFGAVASVLHFNRFARFLKAVFLRCGVVACNYFDDYPIVELSPLSDNTEGTLRAITKLLGITVAEDKDESFSSMTDLLGVTLDLTDQDMNEVRVCNKLERKKDLTVALDEVIKSKIINLCIFLRCLDVCSLLSHRFLDERVAWHWKL